MTEPGGPAWRQTIFFPFALTSRLARGTALDVRVAGDSYESEVYGTVPTVDAVATFDEETGQTAVFLVNRSTSEEAELTINVSRLGDVSILDAQTLADSDVYAANTLENPDRVGLAKNDSAVIDDGTLTITLPAVSWTALSIG
jgi:alpha-N-arabinofuranosidase